MTSLLEDDFIAQLWKIHRAVKQEGYVQDLSLGLFRSDYMLHVSDEESAPSLRQVEFNTISSSFGGLSSKVTQLHTELASFPSTSQPLAYPSHAIFSHNKNPASTSQLQIQSDGLPPVNEAVPTLAQGLLAAHQAYGPSKSTPHLPTAIIILVQDDERNVFDQLALTTHVNSMSSITPVFRLPTSEILNLTSIPASNPSRPLIYTPPASPNTPYEVALVYFRALYAPSEYNTATSWQARHHLERSAAIKCPTVLLHLAGSKKIQQVLTSTDPDHLTSFLPSSSEEKLASLRSTFAPQYSLSDADPTSQGVRLALDPSTAELHVLKPQREGGGNNIYRGAIPEFLKSLPSTGHYKQYILMELIKPPKSAKNTVLRSDGEVVSGDVISELGIFGACLWKRDVSSHLGRATGGGAGATKILNNTEGGYLMRTKGKENDEGGVAAGFSSLDSLILYD